jgi:hypothetical protein
MKPHIDFDIIDINRIKKLLIIDQSEWAHLSEEEAIIDILIPGNKSPFKLPFTKGFNHINSYTSNLISNSCKQCFSAPLLDGVYTVTLSICGETKEGLKFSKTKYFLRTFELTSLLDKIILHPEIEKGSNKDIIIDAFLYLNKAHSSLRMNCTSEVMVYYNKAKSLLEKLEKLLM